MGLEIVDNVCHFGDFEAIEFHCPLAAFDLSASHRADASKPESSSQAPSSRQTSLDRWHS